MDSKDFVLEVKKISAESKLPVRSDAGAAGYDLASAESIIVPSNSWTLIKTGLAMAIPSGYYGRIAPRSGLALKHGIDVGGGVIDENYRDEVGIILFNHGTKNYQVNTGDRIAQLIMEKIGTPTVVEVEELGKTSRIGGFGSTGLLSK